MKTAEYDKFKKDIANAVTKDLHRGFKIVPTVYSKDIAGQSRVDCNCPLGSLLYNSPLSYLLGGYKYPCASVVVVRSGFSYILISGFIAGFECDEKKLEKYHNTRIYHLGKSLGQYYRKKALAAFKNKEKWGENSYDKKRKTNSSCR